MNDKEKAKQKLLERLKSLKIQSEPSPPVIVKNQPMEGPIPLSHSSINQPVYAVNQKGEQNLNCLRPQFGLPDRKEEPAIKNEPRKVMKMRRPFYEHYSKQGAYQPALQYIRNHPNPSGKPPNIPQHLYSGVQVVPKRPWVFFGPENIPPSQCEQINEKNFSIIYEKARRQKKESSGILKKSAKKKKSKAKYEDDISGISDEFTSNFTFSDSVDLSKESDLISEFRSQTRNAKNMQTSQIGDQASEVDEFSSFAGSVTQKQRYNLFNSSDSDQDSQRVNSVPKGTKRTRPTQKANKTAIARQTYNRPKLKRDQSQSSEIFQPSQSQMSDKVQEPKKRSAKKKGPAGRKETKIKIKAKRKQSDSES